MTKEEREIVKSIIEISEALRHAIVMGYKIQTSNFQNQLIALIETLKILRSK